MHDLPNLENVRVIAIAAMDTNRVIGADNDLPWRLPDDLKSFKRLTLNRPIIMGRKTFESIGRPLPKRTNIILTRSKSFQADGCHVAHSVADGLKIALANIGEHGEIIIGGGAVVYSLFMPYLTDMFLTEVDAEVDGDTWFPQWEQAKWKLVSAESHATDERHAYAFEIKHFQRK